MKLTTSTGSTVEVPVSLPDVQCSAYLPRLGVVLGFSCEPSPRDKPEEAEPDTLDVLVLSWERLGLRGLVPFVTFGDMSAEEQEQHVGAHNKGQLSPFVFLRPDDAAAAEEAAGDALEYIAGRLRAVRTEGEWTTLRAIADMRAAELSAWEAWQRLPASIAPQQTQPRDPFGFDASSLPSAVVLANYVDSLAEQAQQWSEQRAEDVEREARREVADGRRTDSEVDAWKDGAR